MTNSAQAVLNTRLTDDQRALLQRRIRSIRWMYLGFCILFVVIAVVMTLGMLSEPGGDEMLPVILGADAVIVLLMLPILWRMRREISKVREDITSGQVLLVTGVVRYGAKATTIRVGGMIFPPPPGFLLRGIDWHAPYTVQYTPRAGVIVGLQKQDTAT